MNEKKIIELFWLRSEQAIDEANRQFGRMCMGIAMNLLGDPEEAEECVNDTLYGLWNAIPPERPENLKAFTARITRNLALKRLRYYAARKRVVPCISFEELDGCIPSTFSVEEELEGKELAQALEAFLKTLDWESRNMFLRRYWFFDSIEQIAAGFGMSKSKVKSKLYRLRQKLKEYLAEEVQIYVGE